MTFETQRVELPAFLIDPQARYISCTGRESSRECVVHTVFILQRGIATPATPSGFTFLQRITFLAFLARQINLKNREITQRAGWRTLGVAPCMTYELCCPKGHKDGRLMAYIRPCSREGCCGVGGADTYAYSTAIVSGGRATPSWGASALRPSSQIFRSPPRCDPRNPIQR